MNRALPQNVQQAAGAESVQCMAEGLQLYQAQSVRYKKLLEHRHGCQEGMHACHRRQVGEQAEMNNTTQHVMHRDGRRHTDTH